MLRRMLLTGLAAGAVAAGGCRHHCCSRRNDPYPPPPSPPRGGFLEAPTRGGTNIPPPSVPTTPPPVIDSRSSYRADPDVGPSPGAWVPPPASIRLGAPTNPAPSRSGTESLFGDPAPSGAPPAIDVPGERKPAAGYLGDPVAPSEKAPVSPPPQRSVPADPPATNPSVTNNPPVTADPPPRTMPPTAPPTAPPSASSRATVPTAVSRLPWYAVVPGRDDVTTGGRPTLDGFDALKSYGFRTVVYVHAPTADITRPRSMAEQRGLQFIPVVVSPTTLGAAFDQFAATVADAAGKPIYVADAGADPAAMPPTSDRTRSGALWYLLFRKRDGLSDAAARDRAAPLGLTDAVTEDQKQTWLAIQSYLANP